jgi:hypothetical protein
MLMSPSASASGRKVDANLPLAGRRATGREHDNLPHRLPLPHATEPSEKRKGYPLDEPRSRTELERLVQRSHGKLENHGKLTAESSTTVSAMPLSSTACGIRERRDLRNEPACATAVRSTCAAHAFHQKAICPGTARARHSRCPSWPSACPSDRISAGPRNRWDPPATETQATRLGGNPWQARFHAS